MPNPVILGAMPAQLHAQIGTSVSTKQDESKTQIRIRQDRARLVHANDKGGTF